MINSAQNDLLWQKIEKISVAMMATQDAGMIRSRPMKLVQSSFAGKIWFFTRYDSPKVDEVVTDEAVNLAFADADKEIYVSMSGLANINNDIELKEKLWNSDLESWFPNGPAGDDVALLEIDIDFAEYWDASSQSMLQLLNREFAKMSDKTPEVGEHQKFS